jgi:hypothetical protein
LPQQKPLEAVRNDVVSAWKKQRGVELAAAAAAEATKRLDAGESWDAVVKSLGGTVQAPKFIARADQDIPMEIRTTAFNAPKPVQKPVFRNVGLASGDAAVLALSAVREDPNLAGFNEAEMRRLYAQRVASGEAQSYAAGARADAKVTLNAKAMD